MAKFKTVYNPRTKTKSVVAFTDADSDEFVAAVSKKEERTTKLTTKDSDGTFELMHRGTTKLKTDANGIVVTGKMDVTTVDLGNWTITESSGVLYFATGGTNKMKLDASGNLTVVGNVTAYGSM